MIPTHNFNSPVGWVRRVFCAVTQRKALKKCWVTAIQPPNPTYGTSPKSPSAGFTYVEVLIAAMIIAICLAPAAGSLQTSIQGQQIIESQIKDSLLLQARFEELLNESFTSLRTAAIEAAAKEIQSDLEANGPSIPSSYSGSVTTIDGGHSINCQIYIAQYDGDNADKDDKPFTGTDAGLLYVKAAIEGTGDYLETLVHQ